MPSMISAERVLNTIHRCPVDRVARNYGANWGIEVRLKKHFGLQDHDREGLLSALGIDFRGIGATYTGPVLHQPLADRPEIKVDPLTGVRTRWIEHSSGGYWDFCDFPLQFADEEAVAAWPLPNPDHFDYEGLRAKADQYPGKALVLGNPGIGDNMNATGFLRNYEQVLLDLATEDPAGKLLMDRRNDYQLAILERTLAAIGDRVHLFWIGEDLGTQIGQIISLDMFRRLIRPRLQKFVDLGKAYKLPVMIHCCGSSSWAFDDFIDMGITVIDTLQPEAKNMAPAYLKKNWGAKLSYHGCISTAGPLAKGTVTEVERCVKETLDTMTPGGGYMLAPTHSIQDDTPTENVLAMYRVATEYGPIG